MKSVLIVDDDKKVLEILQDLIKDLGNVPILAKDGLEASRKFKNQNFDLVITDLHMDGMDGVKLIENIRSMTNKDQAQIPIVVISGNLSQYNNKLAMDENTHLLEKPFTTEEIKNLVVAILDPKIRKDRGGAKFVLNEGDILIKEGELDRNMYWLQKGVLVIFKTDMGNEIVLGRIQEGELVGEISFLDERPRSASVRCETPCELIEIPYSKFIREVTDRPPWFKRLIKTLCDRLRKADKKFI